MERDELKPPLAGRPTGARRGRPTGRGVSKMAASEGRANGRRPEMPPSLPNGESKTAQAEGSARRPAGCSHVPSVSQTPPAEGPGGRQASTTRIASPTVSPLPVSCPPHTRVSKCRLSFAEDSGNSSEDSEAEEPPSKKLSPWRVRNESPPLQKEAGVEEEEEEEEAPPPPDQVAHMMAAEAAAHLTAEQLSPDGRQATAPGLLHQSERKGEEPPADASLPPVGPDEGPAAPAGQEAVPPPPPGGSSPLPPLLEQSERSAVSAHRVKGRGGGRESPPRSPASSSELAAAPHSLRRAEEPLVLLRCLPTQHLPPDSDTDSATEDEAPEDAVQAGGGQDEAPPTRTPPTLAKATGTSPEPRSQKLAEEPLCPPEGPQGRGEPQSSAPPEEPPAELEPPMGPEALVCYEVDLDDPEDKEKGGPERLLLLMDEQAALPLAPLLPQHQVRACPPAAASCPQEPHPAVTAPEDRAPVMEEQDGEAGTSLSPSVHDARGEPRRVTPPVTRPSRDPVFLVCVQDTRGYWTATPVQAQRNQNAPRNE